MDSDSRCEFHSSQWRLARPVLRVFRTDWADCALEGRPFVSMVSVLRFGIASLAPNVGLRIRLYILQLALYLGGYMC